MVKQNINSPELPRFLYYPKRYEHAPGYPRLDVVLIKDISVQCGCQPLSLQLDVVDAGQSVRHLNLYHGLPTVNEQYRVCPGRLLVFEQDGEVLQSFTFGGYLSVDVQPDLTSCVLTSKAPIIPLRSPSHPDLPTQLALEVLTMLAQRHSAWPCDPTAYDLHLAKIDPHQLYCACLDHLCYQRWQRALGSDHQIARDLVDYLNEEIQNLCERGQWPVKVLSVAQLI